MKQMKSLTNKLQNSYQNAKISYISKEKSEDKRAKKKKLLKLGVIAIL